MNTDLLKVIIIDDERLVRDLLKACIDWEEIGLKIIGESSSALEGIELVDKLCPDIIFTDICMPNMDGLEFSRNIIEKHPQVKIIVLTGYEEFEYAKKGIKVGIADFLLKPINDDEIRKTALATKAKIIRERTHFDEYDRLKEQLKQNLPVLKEKLLNELIQSRIDISGIEERLKYFNIQMKDGFYQAALIEILNSGEDDPVDEEKKLIFMIRCMELVRQYFIQDDCINIFFDNSQRVVILCNDSEIDLWDCCETIKTMLINRMKSFFSIGIGNPCNTLDKIWVSYKEARDALKYRYVVGKNQVISFSDICVVGETDTEIDNDTLGNYCFYLRSGLKEKVEEVISNVFSIVKTRTSSIQQVKVLACNFIANVLNVLIEAGIKDEEVFLTNTQPFNTIFKLDSVPEIEDYLKSISLKVTQAIQHTQVKKASKTIQEVKGYIDSNYSKSDISLSEVAKKFYVNLSYLSRIFKAETGLTFVDYLNKQRMEKALKLLNETDMKSYQIAEEVGISDPHYFSVCFKKYTGLCVNDYKKGR